VALNSGARPGLHPRTSPDLLPSCTVCRRKSESRPRRPRREPAVARPDGAAEGNAEARETVGVGPGRNLARMIEAGTIAPDFTLPDQNAEPVRLSDLRGRPVVLYFYPKADTPGCTTQACGIRDRAQEYDAAGAVVVGVSPDPVERVKRFHAGQSLNFTLLADADHAVCDAYGVWVEKTNYGRTYWGAQRSTFILDGDGTVVHVIPKASPKTHDDEVLAALSALSPSTAR
jgi:peroxiredoxin Q/BCP